MEQKVKRALLKSKPYLAAIAVVLFLSNYYICNYFCGDELPSWWKLRCNIYAIMQCITLFLAAIGSTGIYRVILSFGIGLSVSDVADRLFFDRTVFTTEDIAMLIIAIIFSFHECFLLKRRP